MLNNLADNLSDLASYPFILFAVLSIVGGIIMINSTKVIHMVAAIAMTFLSLAGLYVMLNAEFVAFVQVLIYAGAISILMIFGIMMTKHRDEEQKQQRPWHTILTIAGVLTLFGILWYAIQQATFSDARLPEGAGSPLEIGKLMMSKFVVPFELMSVLLTVALIGAIVVAKREED
ncbi:MAG: NADH-quinone oxidoreductase subunit J [Gorillibacterium sp.]|nr:NADH-quinone oxidoreductase subunit J [Gorillibacterium sp.]